MPKLLHVLAAFFIISFGFSQSKVNLKGIIIDENSKLPIESATVYLTSVKDSSVVDYTISDRTGKFTFSIKKIDYPINLKVSYITFQDYKIENKNLNDDKDFGVISLKEAIVNLNEVVIKSEAPPIRIKKDTLEFNVSSFKVRPDANVETLLKQLPGVEIDSDGKITVNGKEVNQILVNGKPFFDKDGKIALQNLPSNIINKVQVTDTKTKKEEKTGAVASSNNASINLTIDEDKNKGFFGKFMAGNGSDKRYESSALINYFKNKRKISILSSSNNINSIGFSMDEVFDNMGGGRNRSIWIGDNGSFGINGRSYGGGKGIALSNLVGINYSDEWTKYFESALSYFYSSANSTNNNITNQTNFLPTGTFVTNTTSNTKNDNFVHNITGQFEIKIDSTASITLEPNYTKSNSKSKYKSNQSSFEESNAILNNSNSDNFTENDDSSFKNTLSFSKSFKRKGKYLSVVLQNENVKSNQDDFTESQTIFYQDAVPDDNRNQFNNSKSEQSNYYSEIEFTQPITDSLKVKLGLEFTNNKNDAARDSFEFDTTNNSFSIANDFLTNRFISTEKTITPNAGFNINRKNYNISASFGTNIIEFSNEANYLGSNYVLNKSYMQPKINAYGNYKFSKTKNIWVNYNYDYDLPNSKQVLAVEDLANPLNTIIGNPDLDYNKNHSIYFSYRDFDYATRSGYGFYSGGNFYENQVVSSTTYDENRKRTTTYQNVNGTYYSWFGLYWNKSFKKDAHKFRIELRLNNNYNISKGFTNSELYKAATLSFSPRANFTYDYGELLTINPSYNYSLNTTEFTNYVIQKASNFSHKFNVQITNYWPKNWTFGNDFGYTYNSNISGGFKKDFYLWNTSLSYSFFEKKLMAKVKVYDLLNQNQNATRNITATSIRDEENDVLKRYIMFSLTYKLEKFAGKEKKSNRMRMY